MSEMEFFHGYFQKYISNLVTEDTDDFYELEKQMGCHFVNVQGQTYQFWGSGLDVDAYGFSTSLPSTDLNQVICLWYNGGAGLHEVVGDAIEKWLKEKENG